ncbi:MAG TPA: AAA family ATPase [Blastocatellia bacterium]|nr:AAA family ATPase [Blastocatellia bacterium]
MLRLEKLEISGFKSFADRTSLVFGEGITGVVGPNGCGKSNIAEAISWVLGEQSPKNLRGGKMEDVIFNGTRDRKPGGMAEVTITLVATADIASRQTEDSSDEDQVNYDHAIETAEHAAEAARTLVAELSPEPEPPEPPPSPDVTGNEDQSATSNLTVDQQPSPHRHAQAARRRRKRRAVAISAGERITVARRLYRTGDSDYLMNGRACLLRDIQDLFAGTGLGGAHYAIIEQGRIGQILSSKPLDRRALIEEAAGITKFKSRKRATELKIESAKQNLTRLNDIISEVERQVNSLKRQAQRARRYRRLREEMRSLQKQVFTADYYRLTETAVRIANELEATAAEQSGLDAAVAASEAEHRAASNEARAAEDVLAERREQAAAVSLEADRVRNRQAFDEQQLKEIASRIAEIEREQRALTDRLALLEAEIERRRTDLTALEGELTREQAELLEREAAYQAEISQLRAAEEGIEHIRQRLLIEIGTAERLRNTAVNLEEARRRLDHRQASLRAEIERAGLRREEASVEHARVAAEVGVNQARLADLTALIAERSGELARLRDEADAMRAEETHARSELDAARHRFASLEELDAHHAYYSDAVQHVLSSEVAAGINALGTLADFVDVEPQYERLVESLFGRELQCVLVPTIDDALAGVASLKSGSLGRGAFLVVGLHGAEGEPGGNGDGGRSNDRRETESESASFRLDATSFIPERGDDEAARFHLEVLRAIDLLGLRPEIKAVVERAFPEKSRAPVVPDIEAALHLSIENPSNIYVTHDGEQVVNGRLIVAGLPAQERGGSLLALKREIKELRTRVEMLGARAQEAGARVAEGEARLRETESEASSLDADHRSCEKAVAAGGSQLEGLARDLEHAEQHVRVVEAELTQTAEERRELEARIEDLAGELSRAEHSRSEVQQQLEAEQAAYAEMRTGAERIAEDLSTARSSVAARAERLRALRSETRRLEDEAEELRSRINRHRVELYESHNRTEQLTAARLEAEAAAARLENECARVALDVDTASEAVAGARARADELEAKLGELRQEAAEARERRSQVEIERARIESEADHLSRTCHSELAMSLEDVVTSVELGKAAAEISSDAATGEGAVVSEDATLADSAGALFDLDAARLRLDGLRAKLDDLGPVNMMALEELEEAEERFGFLSEQRRDILESIKATEDALAEIKRRSRERFRHAFTEINRNFQEMFVELFGGGRGEMMLIDEDDVLESGIDLIAQPPGKRLQNVLLLSGGEKAMAAIALVLAIFQYRPSPFCILDEVDAPLDEVNVGRFSDKVIQMTAGTQFLVITHNKRTMEAARALYGVTMEEPGISKLVSVKFE